MNIGDKEISTQESKGILDELLNPQPYILTEDEVNLIKEMLKNGDDILSTVKKKKNSN